MDIRRPSDTFSIETALRGVAGATIHAYARVPEEPLPAPEPIAHFTLDDNKHALRKCIRAVLELGEHLRTEEKLDTSIQDTSRSNSGVDVNTDEWLASLGPLREEDTPLFSILCDSLREHTPIHIFLRWNTLKDILRRQDRTLTCLLAEAERTSRREWTDICSELYHLLLDHNNALVRNIDSTTLADSDLSCHLSALCMALRIRFYLPRFHRANSLWTRFNDRIHKRYKNFVGFTFQIQLLYMFVAREIQRVRTTTTDPSDNVKRELISDPVRVDDIARKLTGFEDVFCSICQGDHVQSECVSLLRCSCVFGQSCLEALLNRDSGSSSTCPNCRAQLHEPLQWRVVTEAMDDDVFEMGLLGAQFASLLELADEMDVHNFQHSVRERIIAFLAPNRERGVLR